MNFRWDYYIGQPIVGTNGFREKIQYSGIEDSQYTQIF